MSDVDEDDEAGEEEEEEEEEDDEEEGEEDNVQAKSESVRKDITTLFELVAYIDRSELYFDIHQRRIIFFNFKFLYSTSKRISKTILDKARIANLEASLERALEENKNVEVEPKPSRREDLDLNWEDYEGFIIIFEFYHGGFCYTKCYVSFRS